MGMVKEFLPQISLLVLVLVIAVGFIKKINIGFFSIGAAFILAFVSTKLEVTIAGTDKLLKISNVAKGFSSSMFVTLVGVTFLFGMASQNGTLDLFSKKIVALVGKRTYLIPILMFVLSAFISAIGPGHIAAGILMTTFAVYLAFELKINPMPTLYPIASEMCEKFNGVDYTNLISAITATSFAAAISPLSTGGAIIMSSYSAAKETTTDEMNKMFTTLFLLSIGNVVVNVVMAALGVFTLGGLI